VTRAAELALEDRYHRQLPAILNHPLQRGAQIRQGQLDRIRALVEMAYADIPVYREKYQAAGIKPGDLRSWDDFARLPLITKAELRRAFPERCLNPRFAPDELYATRSSGSSGQTLLMRVDLEAIITDTLHGVRQMWLQSGLRFLPEHLVAHVRALPWWFASIGKDYPTAFLSSLIPARQCAERLRKLQPSILSCYPSNLNTLVPYARAFRQPHLLLAVTHSEQSTRSERLSWSQELGVPVLDEYSSGEATRIALELPCGHYHVCEDAVHLEVLHPVTRQAQTAGTPGLAVVTNLLNEAMPFIRYVQGDYVTQPAEALPCAFGWSQLASLDGRVNDSFVNQWGREIPAGTLLDVTNRWMYDSGVTLEEFQLLQESPTQIRALLVPARRTAPDLVRASVLHLEELLTACMEQPVTLEIQVLDALPRPEPGAAPARRRPIQRRFAYTSLLSARA
jgi:phenylacetate-CoA ligase